MAPFETYIQLGFEHIVDIDAYDHMLFLLALVAVYTLRDWKALLILVTAFTLGHSLTLALAALDIVIVRSEVIEFLIPVTIFITAMGNIVPRGTGIRKRGNLQYVLALFFGLIHGLGFSNYFKMLLGAEVNRTLPLLGFNLGIEIGQLLIVGAILFVLTVLTGIFKLKLRDWTLFVSGAAAGVSLILMMETKFW